MTYGVLVFVFWLLTTGQKVENLQSLTLNQFKENMIVKTDKGTEIVTDMVILCTGIKVNSAAYSSAFSKLFPTLTSCLRKHSSSSPHVSIINWNCNFVLSFRRRQASDIHLLANVDAF